MLDSPSLRIAVRRDPPTVEDLRSTTVTDDPVQRRDISLLERARDGDLEAFNDLVTLYQDQLFALVVRMVPDRDQASDAVQEAFFSAYRNLTSFRGGSVKSWLNRICVNAAMDQQRAKKRRPVQPYPELDDETWQPPAGIEADPERTALDGERTRTLGRALAQITDDQRAAIVLYDVEGYDYAEIADMTGVSLGTVKSRIHRGRLALRGLLEDRMELFRGGDGRPARGPRSCARRGPVRRRPRWSRSGDRAALGRDLPGVRVAPCGPPRALAGDPGTADAIPATRLPAHSRGRGPIAGGTRQRRRSSDPRDERSSGRDGALQPRHDSRRVACRPFTAGDGAGGRHGPRRLVHALRGAPCRPRGARRGDAGDADTALPDRLHPDPWPRRATASQPVASARCGRRVRARRSEPAAGDGLHRARSRRHPRRIGADDPATRVRRRKRRAVERGCRAVTADQRCRPGTRRRRHRRRRVCRWRRSRVRRRECRGGVICTRTGSRERTGRRRRAPGPTRGIGRADR